MYSCLSIPMDLGDYYPSASNVSNSAQKLAIGGTTEATTTRINTDFTLEQKLDFITKGLTLPWYRFLGTTPLLRRDRGINDYEQYSSDQV